MYDVHAGSQHLPGCKAFGLDRTSVDRGFLSCSSLLGYQYHREEMYVQVYLKNLSIVEYDVDLDYCSSFDPHSLGW